MMKHLALTLLAISLFLAVPLTFAQEEATAETAAPAPGISTLIFLLGAGAIVIVGGTMLARDTFQSDSDEQS